MSANTIRTGKIEFVDNNGQVVKELTYSGSTIALDAVPLDSGTYTLTGTITQAQLLALADTPVEIVPAQGAGKVIVPFLWQWYHDATGTEYADGGDLTLQYDGDVTALLANQPDPNVVRSSTSAEGIADIYAEQFITSFSNTAVTLSAVANYTGGASTNVIRWKIWYQVVDSLA